MKHFKHIFSNPPPRVLNHINELSFEPSGWFTEDSFTAPIRWFIGKNMFSHISINDQEEASFEKDEHPFPDELYDRLKPALRLASAIFKNCRDYWVFTLNAPIYYDSEDDVEYVEYDYLNQNLRPWWPQVDRELASMWWDTQICWFEPKDDDPDTFTTYGETAKFHKPHLPEWQSKLKFRMAISKPLLDTLDDADFVNKPFVEQCIVHIMLAITLIHEFAHCLYLYGQRDLLQEEHTNDGELDGELEFTPEPFVDTLPNRELGFLFEVFLLGGEIEAEPFCDPTSLRILTYPFDDSDEQIGYQVSDETMKMLLHEDTWRSKRPTSMYLLPVDAVPNHTTTDVMSEHFTRMSLRDIASDDSQEEEGEDEDEGEEDEDGYSQDEDEDGYDPQDGYNSPYAAGDDSEMDWEPT